MSPPAAVALVATAYPPFTVMPLERRIRIMKDLMRGMELVTLVGQGQAMNKMLVLLRREALRLEAPIAPDDLASFSNAMTELEHEVGRLAPSLSIFNHHAEAAIGALRRTVSPPHPSGDLGSRQRDPAVRDVESQARSAPIIAVDLTESLKQGVQVFAGDSRPAVTHRKPQLFLDPFQVNHDAAAASAILIALPTRSAST